MTQTVVKGKKTNKKRRLAEVDSREGFTAREGLLMRISTLEAQSRVGTTLLPCHESMENGPAGGLFGVFMCLWSKRVMLSPTYWVGLAGGRGKVERGIFVKAEREEELIQRDKPPRLSAAGL